MFKRRVRIPLFWFIWFSFILISLISIVISTWMNIGDTESVFMNSMYSRILDRIHSASRHWGTIPHTEAGFQKLTAPLSCLDGPFIDESGTTCLPLHFTIVSIRTHQIDYQSTRHVIGYQIYPPNFTIFSGKQMGYVELYTPLYQEQSFLVWNRVGTNRIWIVDTSVAGVQQLIEHSVIHKAIMMALTTFFLVTLISFLISKRATTLLYQLLSISKQAPTKEGKHRLQRTLVKEMYDIGQLMHEHHDLVRHLSERDALTGAYNRYALEKAMENHFSKYAHTPTVFVLFDLDHFKELNDTEGHQKGDEALQTLVHYCTEHLSENNILARLGGDEFILLFFDQHWTSSLEKQLIKWVRESPLGTYHLGLSMGIVDLPSEATNFPEVYRLADQRLYAAKRAGRNRIAPPRNAPMIPL